MLTDQIMESLDELLHPHRDLVLRRRILLAILQLSTQPEFFFISFASGCDSAPFRSKDKTLPHGVNKPRTSYSIFCRLRNRDSRL